MSRRLAGLTTLALAALGVAAAVARGRRVRVAPPDGPGPPPAGVREPRRPLQPSGAGSVAVDPRET